MTRSRSRFLPTLVVGLSLAVSVARAADGPQAPPTFRVDEQKTAMAKLAYMDGQWNGDGWMQMGPTRVSFRGGERIQRKLDGLALLVEGAFFSVDPKTGKEVPSHTTLGVISFDPTSKTYRFKTWLATGATGERELKLIPDGWQWDITHPRGTMRYTATFKDGDWLEIGERSTDGASWQKFFEMRLKRAAQ